MKDKRRNYWAPWQVEYLVKKYPTGTSVEKMSKHLGNKTPKEIYTRVKYQSLGRLNGQPNKIHWTDADIKFIKDNFHSMTNVQMAKALGKKLTIVRMKCRELNLLHIELQYWTDEQVEYLKANYKQKGDQELAEEFNAKWEKKKGWTKKHIEKKRRYLNLKRTLSEQFTIRTGRFDAADYSESKFDGKEFKQGAKRLWFQNGKYFWMIKCGNKFMKYHRYRWEKLRGPIPFDKKLTFMDGDTTNCKIGNLKLLSKSELAAMVGRRNGQKLSDSYIAGLLSWKNPEMKKIIMNSPALIEAKRSQILLNRAMGKSKVKQSIKS